MSGVQSTKTRLRLRDIQDQEQTRRSAAAHPRDQVEVERWLRAAILAANYSEFFDGNYPRYAWYRDEQSCITYEARLVNREQGSYKGYPLNASEAPAGLRPIP